MNTAYNTPCQKDFDLQTLEISFDRTCNFACSYCNPAFSTTWVKDIKKFVDDKGSKNIFLWAPGKGKSNIVKKIISDKKFLNSTNANYFVGNIYGRLFL